MNKTEFFDRADEYYFFDNLNEIVDYCKKYWIDDIKHIIEVADNICKNTFIFNSKWDLERTDIPQIFENKIDWNYMPKDDPEFVYQLNRHRFWICLGQAYAITKDEKYAKAFVTQLTNWIDTIILTKESEATTWRTIEAGFRGEYWSKAFRYFKDSEYITDEIINKFYNSMIQHGEYIINSYSPFRLLSNWGVIENHGLFDIALTLPQNEITKRFYNIALERLENEICIQVMDDGVHWEQSPMYHNEVLHCYLDVIILAHRNNIKIPDRMMKRIKKMAYVNMIWIKPDGHQLIQGDSDDLDITDTITKSACIFKDTILKSAGYNILDFESVWDLGIKAAYDYKNMEISKPEFKSYALNDSGNYYMRSDWTEKANFLHFHCGTLGAGHGHSDKLHLDLYAYGEDILLDAGRYTYVPKPERLELKSPKSHNTITVDNKDFTICKDSWECSKLSQPVKQSFKITEQFEFVQCGHLGYMDMKEAVFVNRKIIFIKPDIYILIDEMYTGGNHFYNQYFHFNNKGILSKDKNIISYNGKSANAQFYFLTDNIELQLIDTKISRNYNLLEDNKSIKTYIQKNGFCSLITVISTNDINNIKPFEVYKIPVKSVLKGTAFDDSFAEAVKVKKDNKNYIVIVCHQEVISPVDLIEADGCQAFGNVIVCDKSKKTQTVLNW